MDHASAAAKGEALTALKARFQEALGASDLDTIRKWVSEDLDAQIEKLLGGAVLVEIHLQRWKKLGKGSPLEVNILMDLLHGSLTDLRLRHFFTVAQHLLYLPAAKKWTTEGEIKLTSQDRVLRGARSELRVLAAMYPFHSDREREALVGWVRNHRNDKLAQPVILHLQPALRHPHDPNAAKLGTQTLLDELRGVWSPSVHQWGAAFMPPLEAQTRREQLAKWAE